MLNANLKMLSRNVPVVARCLASHAAAAPKSVSSPSEDVKVSSLPSGAILASVPSDSPLARIAVTVRAGARYEPADQLGLTHILRSAAGLSTERHSSFGIVRNIEYFGGRLSVTGTRDTITYLLEMHNDDEILQRNFGLLAETIAKPSFKHWEMAQNTERILADLSVLDDTPYIQLAEALHAVAFKGGLRKSLYTSRRMLGKHQPDRLKKFIEDRYVKPAVVGVGIEHEQLVELVGAHLNLGSHQPPKCVCSFIGGETHIDSPSDLTYVALAAQGAGVKNTKDAIALALFQIILGTAPQIKNSSTISSATRLGRAIDGFLGGKAADNVAVSAFNLAYEDLGLFGINLIAPCSSDVPNLVKTALNEVRGAATSITDKELDIAKKNLKTSILLATDTSDALAYELSQQLALIGAQVDVAKQIDAISATEVKLVASRLLKSKMALATIGRNVPYLDDLVEKK